MQTQASMIACTRALDLNTRNKCTCFCIRLLTSTRLSGLLVPHIADLKDVLARVEGLDGHGLTPLELCSCAFSIAQSRSHGIFKLQQKQQHQQQEGQQERQLDHSAMMPLNILNAHPRGCNKLFCCKLVSFAKNLTSRTLAAVHVFT